MMIRRSKQPGARERGLSMAVEAAIILPAVLALILLGIALARSHMAQQSVETAAASAARDASLARSIPDAAARATDTALTVLTDHNVVCSSRTVKVEAGGLLKPIGVPGSVTVRLTCTVSLADVSIPGMPGQVTLTAERSSPVDAYRSR